MRDLAFTEKPDELFDSIDTDGDGVLSERELEATIKNMLGDESSVAAVEELLTFGNDVLKTSVGKMTEFLASQVSATGRV